MTIDANKLPAEVLGRSNAVEAMALALEKALGPHRPSPEFPHGHVWDAKCDACNWRDAAASALSAYRAAYDASPGPALEAENARLREALEATVEALKPFAALIPGKQYNAGAYSILFADIELARTAIARAKGETK